MKFYLTALMFFSMMGIACVVFSNTVLGVFFMLFDSRSLTLIGCPHLIQDDTIDSDPMGMVLEMYDKEMREAFGELNLGEQNFEGDLTLTEEQSDIVQKHPKDDSIQNRQSARGLSFRKLWLNKTVPYTLAKGLRTISLINIRSAIQEWQDKICITFKERTFEEDYIEFTYEGGCSSSIGRAGGRQVISVGSTGTEFADMSCGFSTPFGSNVTITCTKGNILHEIGHALGFFHEHNRPDRDRYLTVVWQNIMPGCRVHFRKERFTTLYTDLLDVPYDYNSMMHFGSFFFARERGMRTLLANVKGVRIGQREKLSALDVQKGQLLYQCINHGVRKIATRKLSGQYR